MVNLEGYLLCHCRRGDNIKMDLQEVGCEGMDWIKLAQDMDRQRALVTAVMNLRAPQNVGNFLTSWKTVTFSIRTLLHGVFSFSNFTLLVIITNSTCIF
jgi:hypothetical protein